MPKQQLHFFFEDSPFSSRINYVLDFLANHPLSPEGVELRKNIAAPERSIAVYYGIEKVGDQHFFIPRQDLLFKESRPSFAELKPGVFYFGATQVYSVEKTSSTTQQPFCKNNRFGFDILEMLFFHLSRMEEVYCTPEQMDQWDMMKASEQFLYKYKLHQRPVVDQLVDCFYQAFGMEVKERKTEYEMSHDIDLIEKFKSPAKLLRSMGSALYRGRGGVAVFNNLKTYWATRFGSVKDPYNTFDWLLLDTEISKVIYFMAGGITQHDNHYQLEDPIIEKAIALAKERGYRIGLHPSYAAYRRADLLREEKSKLENIVGLPIKDSRQHFLHFSFPDTPALLEEAGIANDATMGYQDCIGFRCGTGFDYHLYNFEEERPWRFKETPMVIMDSALLQDCTYDLDAFVQEFWQFMESNKKNTKISLNFHNSTFDFTIFAAEKLKDLYLQLPHFFKYQEIYAKT